MSATRFLSSKCTEHREGIAVEGETMRLGRRTLEGWRNEQPI